MIGYKYTFIIHNIDLWFYWYNGVGYWFDYYNIGFDLRWWKSLLWEDGKPINVWLFYI